MTELGLYEPFDITELCKDRVPKDHVLTPQVTTLQGCLLSETGSFPVLSKMTLTSLSSVEMTYMDGKTRKRETLFRTNRFERLSIKLVNMWIVNAIYRRFEKQPTLFFHRFYKSDPISLRPSDFELKINHVDPYCIVDDHGDAECGRHMPDISMVSSYTFNKDGWQRKDMTMEEAEGKKKVWS